MRHLIEEAREVLREWGEGEPPWSVLDTKGLYAKLEQTVAANAGSVPVPLGGMLRRVDMRFEIPDDEPKAKRRKRKLS